MDSFGKNKAGANHPSHENSHRDHIQNNRIVKKNMHITAATFLLKGIVKPQKRRVKRGTNP
jgi:hypothetical protein